VNQEQMVNIVSSNYFIKAESFRHNLLVLLNRNVLSLFKVKL
jgi:hypothetical protein